MRFAMAIDLTTCCGCYACAVACKQANNLPNDVWWNNVTVEGADEKDTGVGDYPHVTMTYIPINCQHCSNPACVEVCPTGASHVEGNGIVSIDQDKCIGCSACIEACPYNVRTLYGDELLYSSGFPVGEYDAPQHQPGTVGKCTGCLNRINRGEKPACMELCPGRSRYWGDLDDPESEIALFLKDKNFERLYEEAGTEPNVFYIR